jgi:two-component system OmpR family response regulator
MERERHILVVDDDPEIRKLLQEYLEQNGFRVTTAAEGKSMWQRLDSALIDLIVLDLMMPGTDGLELCRNLRVKSQIPVIMLTARGDEMDRILGLEMGADDYLPKPFNPRELLARIKVVLRRTGSLPGNPDGGDANSYRFACWRLDTRARHLESAQGTVVPLSGAEYRLLHVLVSHPNRILNRDQLLELTQGREADPFDRSIDVLISRLRRRLGEDPRSPQIIKTVRGEGYVLSAPVEKEGANP